MGIKDKWAEGVERTKAQAAAVEAAREEALRAKASGPAQSQWDSGELCYVLTVRYEFTAVEDARTAQVVGEVMKVGWRLHSTAMTFVERTGMNNISCMFTFVR